MKSTPMIKHYLIFFLLPFFACCQNEANSGCKYTNKEAIAFLDDVIRYAGAGIDSYTEIRKKTADQFYITSRYPLSKAQLEEFKENDSTIYDRRDDISDFASYHFKDYELFNEKNEKLQFIDNGQEVHLQEMNLGQYDNILYQHLEIEVKLNKNFEKLKGSITMEFEMPNNKKREVKIPVDISIYDKVLE